jgi:uncharacterized protein
MPNNFATISFTKSVKEAQTKYGSRELNKRFELSENPRNELGDIEKAFITARDSFYMATVSENNWPYVQHRGGLPGFIKVLDQRHIAFADFRGNRQYLSVGNLNANPNTSLILMDYPNQRRLKLWGTSEVIDAVNEPALIKLLTNPNYKANAERAIVIKIEAIEWNCPQHITTRYSEYEVDSLLGHLHEENKRLRQALADKTISEA